MKRKIKRVKAYPIKSAVVCSKCIFNASYYCGDFRDCTECKRYIFERFKSECVNETTKRKNFICKCLLVKIGEPCKDFKRRG